jgi:HEPN domain-containing protein
MHQVDLLLHPAPPTTRTPTNKIHLLLAIVALALGSLIPASSAQAQASDAKKQTNSSTQQKAKTKAPTPAKEAAKQQRPVPAKRVKALMKFAKKHHPEILPLMQVLKKNSPKRYQRVIFGLDREIRSLERIQQRSADAYEVALKQWVNRSKVRLLSAQVSTADSVDQVKKIRRQIRRLLKQNQTLRIKALEDDLKQAQARTKRITELLDDLRKNGDAAIEEKIETTTKLPNKLKSKEAKKKGQSPPDKNTRQPKNSDRDKK